VTFDAVGTPATPTEALPSRSRPADLPRYAVGIINHRTYRDLERCLSSVKAQTAAAQVVVVIDADPDPALLRSAAQRHPEACWTRTPNHGFGAGANAVLSHSAVRRSGSEFVLILNPDIELRPGFAENLLREMQHRPRAALASGKLLRLDGRTLDSTGVVLPRHRRPRDRGSEELDRGQYDRTERMFGVSGAAVMLRTAALADLEIAGEIFDEDFFLYHEDSDLSWRANLLGWDVLYVPTAEALHGRRWQRQKRFEIAPEVRRHSFKNHYLSVLKNERARDFLVNLPVLLAWEVARLGYALLFDRPILAGYRMAWRLRRRMWEKRRVIRGKLVLRGHGEHRVEAIACGSDAAEKNLPSTST